jgi:hypothetical protein
MAAKKVPVIRKRDFRLIVTQVDQQSIKSVEQKHHGDLFHAARVLPVFNRNQT